MRLLRSLLWLVVLGGLGFVALLFLVQNLHTERIVFFGLTATLNFALVVAGAVAAGFLLALLLIVPGRIATAFYARSLDREVGHLERQVAQLSEQRERLLDGREQLLQRYERLYADHGKVTIERERMRTQLAAATAAIAAAQPMPNRAAGERGPSPAAAAPVRQPLALKERDAGREVRGAPVRIAPPAHERRPVAASSAAPPPASTPVAVPTPAAPLEIAAPPAPARAQSVPQVPPIPVASDPPAVDRPLVAPRGPEPPEPPVVLAAPDPPAAATAMPDEPNAPVVPPRPARAGQVRERVTRHTAAAREQLGQWRGHAGRVRRSAGARYNEMRITLLARARAVAGSVRQLPTPPAPALRDTAPPETRAPSASAVPSRDEDGHESSMLKGELPVWRPPE